MLCNVCGTEFNANRCPLCQTNATPAENTTNVNNPFTPQTKISTPNVQTAANDVFTNNSNVVENNNINPFDNTPKNENPATGDFTNKPEPVNEDFQEAVSTTPAAHPVAERPTSIYTAVPPAPQKSEPPLRQASPFAASTPVHNPPPNRPPQYNDSHSWQDRDYYGPHPSRQAMYESVKPKASKGMQIVILIAVIIILIQQFFIVISIMDINTILNHSGLYNEYNSSDNDDFNGNLDDFLTDYEDYDNFDDFLNDYYTNPDDNSSSDDDHEVVPNTEPLYPNGASPDEIDAIRTGMSYAEISTIIGGDGSILEGATSGEFTASWFSEYSVETVLTIRFVDGISVEIIS